MTTQTAQCPVLTFDTEPGGGFPPVLTGPSVGEWARRPAGGLPMLVLRRRRDVLAALSDTRTFAMAGTTPAGELTGCPLTGAEMQSPDGGLLNMNPPGLREYRLRIGHLFTTRQAEATRFPIRLLARHLAARLPGPAADVLAGYVEPFTATAVCTIMGVPAEDWPQVLEWSRVAFAVVPTPAAVHQVAAAWDMLYAYYEPLVAAARARPADSTLISGIAHALDGWATITQTAHVVATCSNGFGAVLPVLAVALTELAARPTLAARVGRDGRAAAAAGDQLLQTRAMFPVALPRVTLTSTWVGDWRIPAGTVVLPSLIGAARDLAAAVSVPCSLPFGPGPHLCPGAALTRVWVHEALQEFYARWPAASMAGPLDWQPGTLSVPREIWMILRG